MLGIEGIKYCRIIPGSWDPVHLPNPMHHNQEVDGGLYFYWRKAGWGLQPGGVLYVTW